MTTQKQQAITKPRIALYGGAFDPVHRAHLVVARAAQEQALLDKVIFIPAARPPLKAHGPIASDADRLKMLELALEGEPDFAVDEAELKRGGISYTLDTVIEFSKREPGVELFWILGGDQFAQLDCWHAVDELVQKVSFLVLARPGYGISAPDINGLVWRKVDAPIMEESSTLVRSRISKGEPVGDFLSESVEAFIQAKGLYT